MITKYAKNCINILRTDTPFPNVGNNAVACAEIKSYSGDIKYTNGKPYSGTTYNLITSAVSQESQGIAIGSGTAAESEDSYALDSQLTSGFTGSVASAVSYDATSNLLTVRETVTISNTGSSDLTITEIGLYTNFATAAKGSNVSSSPRYVCLMDRTLLDEPVTIAADTAGVIYYDFVMDGGAVSTRAKK